jgi:hypothetical protein
MISLTCLQYSGQKPRFVPAGGTWPAGPSPKAGKSCAFGRRAESAAGDCLHLEEADKSRALGPRSESATGDCLQPENALRATLGQ